MAFGAFFVWFAISFGSALTNPSFGTSLAARAAEWARDHHLGFVATWAEEINYQLNPPKKGGSPGAGAFTKGTTPLVHPLVAALPVPSRLRSPAGAWLPGEGVWHPAGRTVHGTPAIFTTQVRPDAVYTSYVIGVAWMDQRLLRAQLYSGSEVPGGGPYRFNAPISTLASRTLDAAFNAGFKMQDANGGYYTDHHVVVPLRAGAASLVVYRDGSATVGAWGTQVGLSPQVASVRQNLDLIVNGGRAVPGLLANDNSQWGATLGGAYAVWRSGVGVTSNGALVYVGGPSLTITSLANLLVDAGAVRAMELDINTDWVQFSTYRAAPMQPVTGANGTSLLSNMAGAPSRYFESWWIRDFFTMSVRPTPDDHLTARVP
ncbi:MAG TPA: phosphodiester glycosidase family protein [Acidimicrobiales bacterium]|nr:phosphodiester glycosidase family protein [Acidimicrobiales bacterium]